MKEKKQRKKAQRSSPHQENLSTNDNKNSSFTGCSDFLLCLFREYNHVANAVGWSLIIPYYVLIFKWSRCL